MIILQNEASIRHTYVLSILNLQASLSPYVRPSPAPPPATTLLNSDCGIDARQPHATRRVNPLAPEPYIRGKRITSVAQLNSHKHSFVPRGLQCTSSQFGTFIMLSSFDPLFFDPSVSGQRGFFGGWGGVRGMDVHVRGRFEN